MRTEVLIRGRTRARWDFSSGTGGMWRAPSWPEMSNLIAYLDSSDKME